MTELLKYLRRIAPRADDGGDAADRRRRIGATRRFAVAARREREQHAGAVELDFGAAAVRLHRSAHRVRRRSRHRELRCNDGVAEGVEDEDIRGLSNVNILMKHGCGGGSCSGKKCFGADAEMLRLMNS